MSSTINLTDPNFDEYLSMLGGTGSATYAPLGTPLPPGMGPYDPPNVNMGFMSDEGLTETIAREKIQLIPWQTTSAIRSAYTTEEFTFGATLWTLGGLATAMRYGVPESEMRYDDIEKFVEFAQGGKLPEDLRFVLNLDVLDGEKHRRFLLPSASVEETPEVTYTKGDWVGYPFTWRANLSKEHGFSVLRRFKEGWIPGTAGSFLSAGEQPSLGDWSQDVNALAASQVHSFDLAGATGGTFDLRVGSSVARDLSVDITADTLQAVLRAVGQSSAQATGDPQNGLTLSGLTAAPSVDASDVLGEGWPRPVVVTSA